MDLVKNNRRLQRVLTDVRDDLLPKTSFITHVQERLNSAPSRHRIDAVVAAFQLAVFDAYMSDGEDNPFGYGKGKGTARKKSENCY